jgi:class 3 adenylate cyclase
LGDSVTKIYRRFFDPYIAELIENQRSLFNSRKTEVISLQERDLTIVFWDISGFSDLFNLTKRQYEVTIFLEQYFGLADRLIHKHNGILNKFIGDGILAIFGYRNVKGADISGAIDALSCAFEFRNLFDEMKSSWVKLWRLHFGYRTVKLDLKCGIDSGEILFGRLGTDNRDEITVLGQVVNFASRLECRAKSNQILISKETKRRVNNLYDFKEVQLNKNQQLRGFPHVRSYYQVKSQKSVRFINSRRYRRSSLR